MIKGIDLFYGVDYTVNKEITIHIPTINEILEYGLQEYYCLVSKFCQTLQEIEDALDRYEITNNGVNEYIIFRDCTSKSHTFEQTKILFGEFSLSENHIDEKTCLEIINCLRQIHGYDRLVDGEYSYIIKMLNNYGELYRDFPISTFVKLVRKKIILPKMAI